MSLEFCAALSYVRIFVMRMDGYNFEGKRTDAYKGMVMIVTINHEHEQVRVSI
jgi:hypothetical protein